MPGGVLDLGWVYKPAKGPSHLVGMSVRVLVPTNMPKMVHLFAIQKGQSMQFSNQLNNSTWYHDSQCLTSSPLPFIVKIERVPSVSCHRGEGREIGVNAMKDTSRALVRTETNLGRRFD